MKTFIITKVCKASFSLVSIHRHCYPKWKSIPFIKNKIWMGERILVSGFDFYGNNYYSVSSLLIQDVWTMPVVIKTSPNYFFSCLTIFNSLQTFLPLHIKGCKMVWLKMVTMKFICSNKAVSREITKSNKTIWNIFSNKPYGDLGQRWG